MTTTPIIQFLDSKNIDWVPIKVWITEVDGLPKKSCKLDYVANDDPLYHFKKVPSKAELQNIQNKYSHYEYIAINTRQIHQVDVDDYEFDTIEFTKNAPYFLSATKKLPHIFYTSCENYDTIKSHLPGNKNVEFLHGQWSFARKDALVYNADGVFYEMPILNNETHYKKELDELENDENEEDDESGTIQTFIRKQPHMERVNVKKIKENTYSCTALFCPHIGKSHRSNHQYFVKRGDCLIQKCHNEECFGKDVRYNMGDPMCEIQDEINENDKIFLAFEEEGHFKVMNPILYCSIENGKFIPRKASEFHEAHKNRTTLHNKSFSINNKSPLTELWTRWRNIKTYHDFGIYPPPLVCPPNTYNTWTGWAASKITDEGGSPDLFIKHYQILFGKHWEWIMTHSAWIIQRPGIPTGILLIIISIDGTGKGTIYEVALPAVMGDTHCGYTNSPKDDLFSKHAELKNNKSLLVVDDANQGEMKINAARLKSLATAKLTTYERKGHQSVSQLNVANIVNTTNVQDPVAISKYDRRTAVVTCSTELVGNKDYFKTINQYLAQPKNIRAIYEYLMNFSLEGLDTQADLAASRPITNEYKDIQSISEDKEVLFLRDYLQEEGAMAIGAIDLYEKFKNWLRTNGFKYDPKPLPQFSKYLRNKFPNLQVKHTRTGSQYIFDYEEIQANLK